MADIRRVPPGRAGRLWLAGRLRTAERAVALLDRKLRILLTEQERFTLLAQQTRARWLATADAAQTWLVRAAVTSGERELELAVPDQPGQVDLQWAAVMGVRYPVQATYLPPAAEPGQRPPSGAALVQTRVAYQQALQAAVAHAAASAAARVVDREVAQTRQRVHAIADRWVPRLEAALHELTERLEESERAETVQLRWVAGQSAGGRR